MPDAYGRSGGHGKLGLASWEAAAVTATEGASNVADDPGPTPPKPAEARALSADDVLRLELTLRRLPGVVTAAVKMVPDPEAGLAVTVGALEPQAVLRDLVLEATRGEADGPVRLDIVDLAAGLSQPAARRPARVRLIAVRPGPNGDEVEVHLAHGGRRSVGRSSDTPLVGPARATMSALRELGAVLPYELEVITRLGPDPSAPVLVVLRSDRRSHDRMGVVRGGDTRVSTVRALLHALNRHLEETLGDPGQPLDRDAVEAMSA